MTSSLVGSEMCIRDSQMGESRNQEAELCQVWFDQQISRRATQFKQISVSYTHLTLPTICSV
eukprot:9586303-Prorocentrum_lima.AAC.1